MTASIGAGSTTVSRWQYDDIEANSLKLAMLRVGLFSLGIIVVFAVVVLLVQQLDRSARDALEMSTVRVRRSVTEYFSRYEAAVKNAGELMAAVRQPEAELDERWASILLNAAKDDLSRASGWLVLQQQTDRSFERVIALPEQSDSWRWLPEEQAEFLDAIQNVSISGGVEVAVVQLASGDSIFCFVTRLQPTSQERTTYLILVLPVPSFTEEAIVPLLLPPAEFRLADSSGLMLIDETFEVDSSQLLSIPLRVGQRNLVLRASAESLLPTTNYRQLALLIGLLLTVIVVILYVMSLLSLRQTRRVSEANRELSTIEDYHRQMTHAVHRDPEPLRFIEDAKTLLLECFGDPSGKILLYLRPPTGNRFELYDNASEAEGAFPAELSPPQELLVDAAMSRPEPRPFPVATLDEQVFSDVAASTETDQVILLPLIPRNQLLGFALIFSRRCLDDLPPTRSETAQGLAVTLSFAIENSRIRRRQLLRTHRLQMLQKVSRAVATNLKPEKVLNEIARTLNQSFGVEFSGMWLQDEKTGTYRLTAYHAASPLPVAGLLEIDQFAAPEFEEAAEHLEPLVIESGKPDNEQASYLLQQDVFANLSTLAVFPLFTGDTAYGVLVILDDDPFDGDLVEIFETLAHVAAVAVQDARRFEELSLLNQSLETVSRHKSLFLAKMSHELKTPLGTIVGFSEVLQRDGKQLPAERRDKFLGHIHNAATHLDQVISDILAHSKIEAGAMPVQLSEFCLASQIEASVSFVADKAEKRGVSVTTELATDLPPIRSDATKVRQVVINLLSNAVKFSHDGGTVMVQLEAMTDEHGRRGQRISVVDHGIGMEPGDLDRIFEEFSQVDESFSRRFEGTGLGLSLVRKLLKLLQGSVSVQSRPGEGSTFTVFLPLRREEDYVPVSGVYEVPEDLVKEADDVS